MSMLRGLAVALSMYSRIPVPRVRWDEYSMRYALCFLPLVGVVIGALTSGWYLLADCIGAPVWLFAAIAAVIPVVVTGGIHLDGFMDTHDALAAHAEPEKRHEILKDPHVGAFAVIHCCMYFLVSAACWAYVFGSGGWRDAAALSVCYIISRAVCSLSVALIPCAKDSGLAYIFGSGASKTAVAVSQLAVLALAEAACVYLAPWMAACAALAMAMALIHFRTFIVRKFAGITGDLAGYMLTRCELIAALAAGCGILLKGALL